MLSNCGHTDTYNPPTALDFQTTAVMSQCLCPTIRDSHTNPLTLRTATTTSKTSGEGVELVCSSTHGTQGKASQEALVILIRGSFLFLNISFVSRQAFWHSVLQLEGDPVVPEPWWLCPPLVLSFFWFLFCFPLTLCVGLKEQCKASQGPHMVFQPPL